MQLSLNKLFILSDFRPILIRNRIFMLLEKITPFRYFMTVEALASCIFSTNVKNEKKKAFRIFGFFFFFLI